MNYIAYKKENAALMVFLHGGGVSSWMWDEQVKYFISTYHCIVPDLPGHGSSRNELFSIRSTAEKVIQLIDERKKGRPVIVIGFSLGAQVLVQILSMQTELIDFAIINSALTKPMNLGAKLLTPLFKLSFPLVKMRSFAKLQAKVLYINDQQFDMYYKETTETTLETFMKVMKENMSFAIPSRYNAAKTKILVTVGEKEKNIMKKSAMDLVHANPNSTGIIIPKIGHGISIANPAYFNTIVEQWITEGVLPREVKIIPNQK
ncbi:alpha/beta fold hydrolase [Ornithinibacillus californiensis]|uniref:alpha/beta fold hydrolase n=1 Tax=Ornithinibacillus californiensis TaxID=161536 RepID=UPI000B088DEA|nr:alpha/beta hydrolase [Ornithinibacillus californiensis]